jgi:Fe-Mn family superoxide dismutase
MKNNRRSFLQISSLAGIGIFASSFFNKSFAKSQKININLNLSKIIYTKVGSSFTLPELPYAYNALEPVIDELTMTIHHDKHHATYVTKLNEAIDKASELKSKTLEELLASIDTLPENIRQAVRNHGGGHWNHSFFWQILKPISTEEKKLSPLEPERSIEKAIIEKYKSIALFVEEFNKSGAKLFGSGWTWLIKDANGNLDIINTSNQDNPIMSIAERKGTPIIGIDVWEHAYYLKHQNKRADYLTGIWQVINWDKANELYVLK